MSEMNRKSNPDSTGPESLRERSISGLLWTFSRVGGMVVLRLVVLIVLARLVTPEEFGVMNAALIVFGFSALFFQMGVGPALVQRVDLRKGHIRTGLTASIMMSLGFGAALALLAPIIADFFDFQQLTDVLRVTSLVFPLQGIGVVARSLLQRDMKFRTLAVIEIAAYTLGYGVIGIGLGVLGAGVWSLVLAHLSMSLIAAIALLITGERDALRPGFDRRCFNELMLYGGGFTLAKVMDYFASTGDNIVVGRSLGAAALGAYGRAYQLVVFPVHQLSLVINQVLFPVMAQLQSSKDRLAAAFRRGVSTMALVFGPLSVVAAVLADEVVSVVLGPDWSEAVAPFAILALGMTFRGVSQVCNTLAQATGAVYRRAWRQSVYAGAILAGSWIGQQWGLSGVATGVLAANVLNFALMAHLGLRLTPLGAKQLLGAAAPALWLATSALVVSLATSLLMQTLHAPDLLAIVVVILTVFLFLGGLVRFRPTVLGPDREWLGGVLREVIRRLTSRGNHV